MFIEQHLTAPLYGSWKVPRGFISTRPVFRGIFLRREGQKWFSGLVSFCAPWFCPAADGGVEFRGCGSEGAVQTLCGNLLVLLKMDVTVSELMSNFMESPLVVWVSN